MNIDRIELAAATGHWIYTNASHMDYYRFYKYNFAFSNEPLWKTFDNGTFTLLGHYLTNEKTKQYFFVDTTLSTD